LQYIHKQDEVEVFLSIKKAIGLGIVEALDRQVIRLTVQVSREEVGYLTVQVSQEEVGYLTVQVSREKRGYTLLRVSNS
jgi:hypothetical protein